MRRLRHLLVLCREMLALGSSVGALWIVPVFVLLVVIAILAVTVHATAPFVVYTFF